MQFHFLTKPQLPCADPAWQPETPIGTPWQGSGARAASAVPTFHISFPRANPPQKCLTPQPAEPTPPLPTVKGRLLLDSKSTGLSRELMRCPFPQKHRCWTNVHLDLQEHPHLLLQKWKFCLQFYSVEKKPQNEKSDLLLFHVKTEPTWGVGEIKKGCISIASFIWQYRSLKCNWISWTKILYLNCNHTHNYSYCIKKPCKNYHVLSVLGYFLIFERGILNYSASDKVCHVHFQVSLSLCHKSIPPNQSVTSLSWDILNCWTMCHRLTPALLWCTTDNFKMAYETPPPTPPYYTFYQCYHLML